MSGGSNKDSRPTYWEEKEASGEAVSGPGPRARRSGSWVLPAAVVVMTLLVVGLVGWLMTHRSNSASGTPSSGSSVVTVTQSSSKASASSTSSVTSSTEASTSSSDSASSPASTNPDSSTGEISQGSDFPANVVDTCIDYTSANNYSESAPRISVADNGLRFAKAKGNNSCSFVHSAAQAVRSEMKENNASRFTISVYSDYRSHKLPDEDPNVQLACVRTDVLAHCTSTGNSKVDMYVKP